MDQPLWTWPELRPLGVQSIGNADMPSGEGPAALRVVSDSRLVEPGDLFIALPGDPGPRFNPSYRSDVDGHDFVGAAATAGAVAAMVHRDVEFALRDEFGIIRVSDTYDGLWALGRLARQRLTGPVFAVTGSSGKTTTKQFLTYALGAYSPPGSYNNHIGVPLALANAPSGAQPAVFEVGTNHPGEIEPLARLIEPDFAVVLNVHTAHIENFPNQKALYNEKISIFNALKDKSKAISLYSLAVGYGYTFGFEVNADAHILKLDGDRVEVSLFGERVLAKVPGGSAHRALAVVLSLLCAKLIDHDLEPACALPGDLVPSGRGNEQTINGVTLIDESYNANPESMQATLEGFLARDMPTKGRRIAVVGEMLELGARSDAAHSDLARALRSCDVVFCVGSAIAPLARQEGYAYFASAEDPELMAALVALCKPQDAVLIKGSNRVFWQYGFVDALARAI